MPALTLATDPSQSVPQRDESTTALQALTQWNHRLVEAMAVKLGDGLKREVDPVTTVFHRVLSRPPSAQEHRELAEFARQHGHASLARVLFNLNGFVYLD